MIDHMVEHELALPGGRFRYLAAAPPERADAPLMVLLHGFPDHPRSFGPVMARMVEAGYRVVAPWMRGYHPSVRRDGLDDPLHVAGRALDQAAGVRRRWHGRTRRRLRNAMRGCCHCIAATASRRALRKRLRM